MAKKKNNDTTANLGFEAKLWQAADALRNNMDAAEYKHVVLGLIFLKYISDAIETQHDIVHDPGIDRSLRLRRYSGTRLIPSKPQLPVATHSVLLGLHATSGSVDREGP